MDNIDTVRNFWDARPCNIKHSNSPLGTVEYFNEVEKRKYFVEPHILKFAEFKKWKNKKVLEIGCGIGTDAVNFVRNSAIYTGIELSEKSLQIAKDRFKLFGLEGNFYCGNAEDIDSFVPVDNYDLIYSFGVIHHTPNPVKIVNKIQKYMDKNSEFRLMLYAKNSWKAIMIEAGIDQPEAQYGCPIANTYSLDNIKELLKKYDIFSIEQDHIFPFIIEKYIKYEYEIQPWFKEMSENMFTALEKNLGWHTLIKCKLKENK
jgi:SAM-dependent methyltransferase